MHKLKSVRIKSSSISPLRILKELRFINFWNLLYNKFLLSVLIDIRWLNLLENCIIIFVYCEVIRVSGQLDVPHGLEQCLYFTARHIHCACDRSMLCWQTLCWTLECCTLLDLRYLFPVPYRLIAPTSLKLSLNLFSQIPLFP